MSNYFANFIFAPEGGKKISLKQGENSPCQNLHYAI